MDFTKFLIFHFCAKLDANETIERFGGGSESADILAPFQGCPGSSILRYPSGLSQLTHGSVKIYCNSLIGSVPGVTATRIVIYFIERLFWTWLLSDHKYHLSGPNFFG